MKYVVKEVSFECNDSLGFELNEVWEFSECSISTPHGIMKIGDCMRVDDGQFVGLELYPWMSTLRLDGYDGYNRNDAMPSIKVVAFVRHPHNVWLWVYMFNEAGENIATFCGLEENLDDFSNYVRRLERVDYSSLAHIKAEEYKIMEIGEDCYHSRYGSMGIVRANPIRNDGSSRAYTPYCNRDTEDFFIGDKMLLVSLMKLAQGEGVWVPKSVDFKDEECEDEGSGVSKIVHIHRSLTDPTYDGDNEDWGISDETPSELMTRLIPNAMSKKMELEQQWLGGWRYAYPSLQDYVRSLATDGHVSDFFGWLFGDRRFYGLKKWALPDAYVEAYEEFLECFPR